MQIEEHSSWDSPLSIRYLAHQCPEDSQKDGMEFGRSRNYCGMIEYSVPSSSDFTEKHCFCQRALAEDCFLLRQFRFQIPSFVAAITAIRPLRLGWTNENDAASPRFPSQPEGSQAWVTDKNGSRNYDLVCQRAGRQMPFW